MPCLFLTLLGVLLWSLPAEACSPVIPMILLFSGPALWVSGSALGLLLAVGVKTIAFVRLEKRLKWFHAAWLMVAANLFSTVMGILMSTIAFSAPVGILVTLPLAALLTLPACRRLKHVSRDHPSAWARRLGKMGVLWVVLGMFLSLLLMAFAASVGATHLPLYWVLKVLCVTVGLTIAMGLTTFWEEWVVARLASKHGDHFAASVGRANLYAFAAVALIAALVAIPARLQHPQFLLPGGL